MAKIDEQKLVKMVLDKFEESLTASSVALFHQVLLRENRKEVLDTSISKTIELLEQCNTDWAAENQDILSILPQDFNITMHSCLDKVKSNLKQYVYKSSVYELIP